jgi:hypothetical protein
MQNNINSYQNLKISVKLSSDSNNSTLGIATVCFNTQSWGWIKINGFRVIKVEYDTDDLPSRIDIKPPSFRNRFGKYSTIFFFPDNDLENSKAKWNKLKVLIYRQFENEQKGKEADLDNGSPVSQEIDPNEIDEILGKNAESF